MDISYESLITIYATMKSLGINIEDTLGNMICESKIAKVVLELVDGSKVALDYNMICVNNTVIEASDKGI